jgi:octaprenyl-diphosphate synthase
MGDYLYSRGVTELAKLGNVAALEVLAQAANEMAMGEMRQLTAYDALNFGEDEYYTLIASKTASLMSAACEMGALAGIPSYRSRLAEYGSHLGMAFQITDDLLDYTACETITGKPSGQDLREHKVTLPLVGALAHTTESEHRQIRTFFDSANPSEEDIARIIGIVEERGGLEYARVHADRCGQLAQASLSGLSESPALAALTEAVNWVVDRQR